MKNMEKVTVAVIASEKEIQYQELEEKIKLIQTIFLQKYGTKINCLMSDGAIVFERVSRDKIGKLIEAVNIAGMSGWKIEIIEPERKEIKSLLDENDKTKDAEEIHFEEGGKDRRKLVQKKNGLRVFE